MVRIKICGVTNWADAKAASEAGANLIGFNFYEKSLRRVSTAEAAQIRMKLPREVETVGIFVNAPPADIIALQAFVRFHAAQLHGDETPAIASQIARGMPVIKAFRVTPAFNPACFGTYPDTFAFLLDAAAAGQFGGTGKTSDWTVAQRASQSHRIILAGGLKIENVAEAVRMVRPYAVDVASGLESKPGKKDHAKVAEFIQEVRRAESESNTKSESVSQA